MDEQHISHEAGESDGRGVVEHLEVELADVRRLLQDTERSYESRVWELEQQMSHLLAHGQNRNQYTGSEPTTTAASDDETERRRRANSTMRLDNSNPFPITEGPTTPKPQPFHWKVEADGLLPHGKGTIICHSWDELMVAVRDLTLDRVYGKSGDRVVITVVSHD